MLGEGDRLAGGGDVHAGEQLVDDLERGADAGLVTEPIDGLGDGGEHRLGRGEGVGAARGHDGQLAAGRPRRAAAHRRVEIVEAGLAAPLGEASGVGGGHRRRGQHDAAVPHGRDGAAARLAAEQDGFGLRRVDDDHDDDARHPGPLPPHLRAGAPPTSANLAQRRRIWIVAGDGAAGTQKRVERCRTPWTRGR